MVKIFILFIILGFSNILAQDINKTLIDEKYDEIILIGLCNREAFTDSNFSYWFDDEYEIYSPKFSNKDLTSEKLNECEITIVMGTWCSDSQMHVPAFYKILDELNFTRDKETLICVNNKKEGLTNEVEGLEIKLVPTFIIYKDNKEIGRIIETPATTLENDLEILLGIKSGG